MLINSSDLTRLALLDSPFFDKEGYLFVKEKQEGLFNQWKSEAFIERLCRLRGNLLFLLVIERLSDSNSDNSSQTSSSSQSDRIVSIIILEEFTIRLLDEVNKHFGFIIEFSRGDPSKPLHFATHSHHERDDWIQAIHLASFSYLKSLLKALCSELHLPSSEVTNDESEEYEESKSSCNQQIRPNPSILFSLSCDSIIIDDSHLKPNLCVYAYFRTIFKPNWNFLGKTEIILNTTSCHFKKQLALPVQVNLNYFVEFRFKVYNIVEHVTLTKYLIGDSILKIDTHEEEKNEFDCYYKLILKSPIDHSSVGILSLSFTRHDSSAIKLIKKSASIENIHLFHDNNHYYSSFIATKVPFKGCSSLPDLSSWRESNMCEPNQVLDPNIFTNTIHRSFQFSSPKNKIMLIDEFMSESVLSFVMPQMLMNMFMDEEKTLMDCVTYSLGQVRKEWQRSQMKVLESNLRLVNFLTESLNKSSQYQLENSFRPSALKGEQHLQFIPLNFHLQRCLVSDSESFSDNNNSHRKILRDFFTVGAFACHMLGFSNGGLKSDIDNEPQKNIKSFHNVWTAMKSVLKVYILADLINRNVDQLLHILCDKNLPVNIVQEHINNKLHVMSKDIVSILDPKLVENALAFSENMSENKNLSCLNASIARSMENNSSIEDNKTSNNNLLKNGNKMQSLLNFDGTHHDYDIELEPIDLIHINILASIMSISSKIINCKDKAPSKEDLESSNRKLKHALASLIRTANKYYASEAIQLNNDQLEHFYSMRIRRYTIFSQGLSSLVSAVISQVNSPSFLDRIAKLKTILVHYESLLSCYSEETGMLEDLHYTVNQIDKCVKFIFEINRSNSTSKTCMPRIEGNSFNLRVIFPVKSLPNSLKTLECNVVSVLFNIGINERATYAETFGSIRLQQDINNQSYSKLSEYVSKYCPDDSLIFSQMNALKYEISANRAKNVKILEIVEEIVTHMEGLRFTGCKSGKDRTSMGVTLEEVRMCTKMFGFNEVTSPQLVENMLDTLRTDGTRRENTKKNVGVAKYAFNSLQMMTFPKLYRAPIGTCSSIET